MSTAGMLQPSSKLLIAANAVTATGNSASFVMPWADAYRLILKIGTVTGTTPTFDAVLQDSPDGGVTWANLPLRFTQVTATGTAANTPYIIFKPVSISDAASAGVVAGTGGALAANTPINVQNVRLAFTISGTTPVINYSLYANMIGRGQMGF